MSCALPTSNELVIPHVQIRPLISCMFSAMSSHPAEEISSQSAIPNSTGASVADNTSSSNTSSAHFPSTRGGRSQRRGRKGEKGKAGRPEEGNDAKEKSQLAKSDKPKPPPRPRPTHCESLSFSTNMYSSVKSPFPSSRTSLNSNFNRSCRNFLKNPHF